MREGDAADSFYVIRPGRVALEIVRPAAGRRDHRDDRRWRLVGWSWLSPPYRVQFDARALGIGARRSPLTRACLRGKCRRGPCLGYELMRRFIPVIVERLQATRVQMLDVYGRVAALSAGRPDAAERVCA